MGITRDNLIEFPSGRADAMLPPPAAVEPEEPEKPDDTDFIAEARRRFNLAAEVEAPNREEMLIDTKFQVGDQWDGEVMADREARGLPCLTNNRVLQFVNIIVNEERQNRPSIKVVPGDGDGNEETADIRAGMMRQIHRASDADISYDFAYKSAVGVGRGFWEILTDYTGPESFEQEVRFGPVEDHTCVYLDPSHRMPDGSDARWGFIARSVAEDDFKRDWAEAQSSGIPDWGTISDSGWFQRKTVRVVKYYYTVWTPDTLLMTSEGRTLLRSKLTLEAKELMGDHGITIVRERKTQIPSIKWALMTGMEVLERGEFPGQWVPIVKVEGDSFIVQGQKILSGIVRHARDPQRMLNFWASCEAEVIGMSTKAPWIGAEGQFDNHPEWDDANHRNYSKLEYNPVDVNGKPAPTPHRNAVEPPVQAISRARLQAADDLKAVTGIYDAAVGNRSNETSGVAIEQRAQQTQIANLHFQDNMRRSMRHSGRIINDLLSVIYDAPRTVRIVGADNQERFVRINEMFTEEGKSKQYRMDAGKYDVSIEQGPSYATMRQEAARSMENLLKIYPDLMKIAGDLWAKNLDWPDADELEKRLKTLLPPEFQDAKGDKDQKLPAAAMKHMQMMAKLIEQMTAELKATHDQFDEKKAELASKERIAYAGYQTQIAIEAAKIDSKDSQVLLQAETAQLQQMMASVAQSEIDKRDAAANQSLVASEQAQGRHSQQPEAEQPIQEEVPMEPAGAPAGQAPISADTGDGLTPGPSAADAP